MNKPKEFWEGLSTRAKAITATIAAAIAIAGVFTAGVKALDRYISNRIAQTESKQRAAQCVSIPASGHYIESASPGEWATVEWREIERLKECGIPDLTGVVVNGDGIFHDVDLSISGINLDVGVIPMLRYKFKVPENAEPGSAWFRTTLDFHADGRTINSPRVFFTILEPEKAQ